MKSIATQLHPDVVPSWDGFSTHLATILFLSILMSIPLQAQADKANKSTAAKPNVAAASLTSYLDAGADGELEYSGRSRIDLDRQRTIDANGYGCARHAAA